MPCFRLSIQLGLPFVQPLPLFYSDLSYLLCFVVSSILLCLQPVLELYPVLPLACPEDLLSKVDLITASSVQVFIDRVDL